MAKKLHITSMGCKVNRADAAREAALAEARGFEVVRDGTAADLYILNTCTVTAKSDAEVRQLVRRMHRANPAARVIVAGCLPRAQGQLGPEFGKYCTFVREHDFSDLIEALDSEAPPDGGHAPRPAGTATFADYTDRVRPFLKVQDGCDSSCTYCIVPRARGRSRSVEPEVVAGELAELLDRGYMEVVLTGIHLGVYGRDLGVRDGLVRLLERVSTLGAFKRGARLRLSSIEPLELTPALTNYLASAGFVCRHLHIPLQSGCDRVLRLMNRPYDTARYAEAVERAASGVAGVCMGTDLICGFPGETPDDHRATVEAITALPLSYLHAFTFSPRPGTPAASMGGRPQPAETRRRVGELRGLGEVKRAAFRRSMEGALLRAIVERPQDDGSFDALTDNYIRVQLHGDGLKTGGMVYIVLDGAGAVKQWSHSGGPDGR
ncbi:MAG: MiaB/RimO family radical SAM methylthiotransferase [Myxococcota bacterium]